MERRSRSGTDLGSGRAKPLGRARLTLRRPLRASASAAMRSAAGIGVAALVSLGLLGPAHAETPPPQAQPPHRLVPARKPGPAKPAAPAPQPAQAAPAAKNGAE